MKVPKRTSAGAKTEGDGNGKDIAGEVSEVNSMERPPSETNVGKTRIQVYADLLVDAVRRQTLLPSDLLDRKLRLVRSDAQERVPGARVAIFSSRPLNIVTGTRWFTIVNACCAVFVLYIVFTTNFEGKVLWRWLLTSEGEVLNWGQLGDRGGRFALVLKGGSAGEVSNCSLVHGRSQISGFGLLEEPQSAVSHCRKMQAPTIEWSPYNCSRMTLTYAKGEAPASIHGWYVVHTNQGAAGGELHYSLEHETGDGDWVEIDRRSEIPPSDTLGQARGEGQLALSPREVRWFLNPPWPAYFTQMGSWVLQFCLFLGWVFLSVTAQTRHSHGIVVWILFITALSNLVGSLGFSRQSSSGYKSEEYPRYIQSHMVFAIMYSVIAAFCMGLPRFPEVAMLCLGIGIMCVWILFYNSTLSRNVLLTRVVILMLPTLCALYVIALRVHLWWRAKSRIHRKVNRLCDRIWRRYVSSDPLVPFQLTMLERVVSDIELAIPTGTVARQLNLKVKGSTAKKVWQRVAGILSSTARAFGVGTPSESVSRDATGSFSGEALGIGNMDVIAVLVGKDDAFRNVGFVESQDLLSTRLPFENVAASVCNDACRFVVDPLSPIKSLDQLWTQAIILRGFLLPKVLRLADRFNGIFPVLSEDSEGNFAECPGRIWVSNKEKFCMGGIKSPSRGIEKADAAYGGDVSRLLDVCRESIIFEAIEDMAACLQALKDDPEVSIVRIKSSMTRSGLKPYISTGLRFISVNLRIRTPQTTKLAVHSHICEVLFMLKNFAELVDRGDHSEYTEYRNHVAAFDVTLLPGSKMVYSASVALRSAWKGFSSHEIMEKRRKKSNSVAPTISIGSVDAAPAAAASTTLSQRHLKEAIPVDGNSPMNVDDSNEDQVASPLEALVGDDGKVQTTWGVALCKKDIHKLECVCKLGSLGLSTHMDKMLGERINTTGLGSAWLAGVFSVPNALIILAARKSIQILALAFGLVLIVYSIPWTTMRQPRVVSSYRHFRYTSLADGRGSAPATSPGIRGFGILQEMKGDCARVHAPPGLLQVHGSGEPNLATPQTIFQEGASIVISFAGKVPFTGWYIDSPEGGADTSNFRVYASNYEAVDAMSASRSIPLEEWVLVGTPSWKLDAIVPLDESTDLHVRHWMPESEGQILFEPTRVSGLASIVPRPSFGYGIGFVALFIAGRLHKSAWVKPSLVSGALSALMIQCMWIANDRVVAFGSPIYIRLLETAQHVWILVGISWSSRQKSNLPMLVCFNACAATSTLMAIIKATSRRPLGDGGKLVPDFPTFGIVIWTFLLASYLSRLVATYQARKLVSKDMQAYNGIWKQEVERDTGQISLQHLSQVVKMLGLDDIENTSSTAPSQQNGRKFLILDASLAPRTKRTDIAPPLTRQKRLGEDVMFELLNCMSVPFSQDKNNVVHSYGQLFVQSILLHGILREKIKAWASSSQGYFPVVDAQDSSRTRFVKWVDAKDDPQLCDRVHWPLIKRSTRAVEKLARVYKGNVSRLSDIVRFSLYFDTFTDLTQALGVIVTDFDAKVERVKSRMSLVHDGNATAGYRDVLLNLRVCTKETAMLGCDTHLCEVQLVLKSFGELKSAQGHRRYVQFRDLRGE